MKPEITQHQIEAIQRIWGDRVVNIGKVYTAGETADMRHKNWWMNSTAMMKAACCSSQPKPPKSNSG